MLKNCKHHLRPYQSFQKTCKNLQRPHFKTLVFLGLCRSQIINKNPRRCLLIAIWIKKITALCQCCQLGPISPVSTGNSMIQTTIKKVTDNKCVRILHCKKTNHKNTKVSSMWRTWLKGQKLAKKSFALSSCWSPRMIYSSISTSIQGWKKKLRRYLRTSKSTYLK